MDSKYTIYVKYCPISKNDIVNNIWRIKMISEKEEDKLDSNDFSSGNPYIENTNNKPQQSKKKRKRKLSEQDIKMLQQLAKKNEP